MFDAYTIKKVMPRLVAAVILIQLSWPLFTGAITMVNQIAWGIEGIMYMPFGGRDAVSLSNSLASVAGTGEIVGLIGGGMLWIGFSAIGGMAIAIAILTAIAAAYFTLIVRQVIIILLVLTGPIALVAWILPNTEKLWKLWWGTFSKALLMYPLVLMLVAAGRITAHITSQAYGPGSGGGDFTATVMVLILFFAPFFLLPKTFAFAGGAIAGVSGAIAGRGAKLRGMAFKRSMNKQGRLWSGRKEKFASGGFKGAFIPRRYRGAVMDRVNSASRRVALGPKGRFGFGAAGETAEDTKLAMDVAALSKDESYAVNANNEPVLRALASGDTEQEAIDNLVANFGYSRDDANALAARARTVGKGFGRASRQAAAQQLATSPTGYDNIDQMISTLAGAAGGSSQAASRIGGFANAAVKKAGREDLGPGYGALVNAIHREGNITPTGGGSSQVALGPQSPEDAARTVTGTRSIDATQIIRGRPESVGHITDALEQHAYNQAAIAANLTGTYNAEEVAAAQAELDSTSEQIRDLQRSAQMGYGSTINNQTVLDLVDRLDRDNILTVLPRNVPNNGDTSLHNPAHQTPSDPDSPS